MKKSFNILLVLLVVILAVILQKLEWIPTGRDLLRNYKRSLITKEEMKDLLVQEWRKHFDPKKSDLEGKHLEMSSWAMAITGRRVFSQHILVKTSDWKMTILYLEIARKYYSIRE